MAIKVAVGTSTARDYIYAAKEALAEAKANLGAIRIDLAIIFTSVDLASPSLLRTIAASLGPVPLIGASSLAVISNKGIFTHGLSIMLLSFSEGAYFNTACVREIKSKPIQQAGQELAKGLTEGPGNMRRDLGIVFSDGLIPDAIGLIHGLQQVLGSSFPIAGACASDRLTFKKTYVYYNREILNDAACGILWGGKLSFGLGVKHGWKPLGKMHRLTKCEGNIIREIDGHPAVKLYQEYTGMDLEKLKNDLRHISIFYPLGIYIAGEEEYLLRNVLSIQEDGALVLQGDIPADSLVRLMIGTKESCLNAARRALEEAKTALFGHRMDFAFIFDSASRFKLLGRQAREELEIIKAGLGKDMPLMGLYTYGEEALLRSTNYLGRAYLHNQTITILGIAG